jgi:hypothetical protein
MKPKFGKEIKFNKKGLLLWKQLCQKKLKVFLVEIEDQVWFSIAVSTFNSTMIHCRGLRTGYFDIGY